MGLGPTIILVPYQRQNQDMCSNKAVKYTYLAVAVLNGFKVDTNNVAICVITTICVITKKTMFFISNNTKCIDYQN